MRLTVLATAFLSFLQPPALSQAPAFEAASIKPGTTVQTPAGSQWKSTGARRSEDPGRITYQNVTLLDVLMRAYQVKRRQISAPAWIESETYDIVATIPTSASKEQIPVMLRNLLAERFKMVLHIDDRQERVYALTAGKNSHLKESKETESSVSFDRNGNTQFVGYTLTAFADALTNLLDRAVVDATEIPGRYDLSIHLDLPGAASREPDDPAPSLFTSIQQLGLKLEAREGPVKHLTVDKADKLPTAN